MRVEPSIDAINGRDVVYRGSSMRCKRHIVVVVGERAFRNQTGIVVVDIGLIVDVVVVDAWTHIEGIERGHIVVAQSHPQRILLRDVHLLRSEQIHTGEHGIVVECVPVELCAVVANDQSLEALALLQRTLLDCRTGLW